MKCTLEFDGWPVAHLTYATKSDFPTGIASYQLLEDAVDHMDDRDSVRRFIAVSARLRGGDEAHIRDEDRAFHVAMATLHEWSLVADSGERETVYPAFLESGRIHVMLRPAP